MENAFISMCYIHKGQTKFTNRVRKRCKYYLDGVGIKVSLQEACSLTRAVSAFQKHAMRRHSGVQRSLPSGQCIGQKAGSKLARWTWRINHRYSVCTCDCIWISGIHANVVEQYIMFVTWCYVTLYYIILYIILYYYDYGDQLKGLSWVGLVAEGDAGLMAGFLKAGSVGTR